VNDKVHVVSARNWDAEVMQSNEPVLVDFWAEWCPPCRALAPTVDALAEQYHGRLKVAKLDVDESPEIAGRYGVQSIPTLLLFRGGKVVEQRIGAMPKDELVRMVEPHAKVALS
jgi:thioredoxin 1